MINKKDSVKYIFAGLAVASSLFLWIIIDGLVNTATSENWVLPAALFSAVFTLWATVVMLEESKIKLAVFSGVLCGVGLLLAQDTLLILSVVTGTVVMFFGAMAIRDSMFNRIKISIWTSLRLGRRFFVMAIVVVIVGGFLMPVLLSGKGRSLPILNIEDGKFRIFSKTLALVDPSIEFEELDNLTVDEYVLRQQLLAMKKAQQDGGLLEGTEIVLSEKEKDWLITSGRASVTSLVERRVSGDELIVSVFVEIVNNKINGYFNTGNGVSSEFAPWVFAGLAFFAILSVGSLLSLISVIVVIGIFKILLLTKVLKIDTKSVEVELIN